MSGWSWMAALTLAAGILPSAARADDPPETTTRATPPSAPATTYKVKLALSVAGLTARGCDVEVKPAHAGCTFKTVVEHIDSDGLATLSLQDVRTVSADRDCSFAITIREEGLPARTTYRGLQLSNRRASTSPQVLNCILSSPSRLARISAAEAETRKR
jgi:hypothetical protein